MSGYLIDTHTLIWWWDSNPKLPSHVEKVLEDRSNTVFVSAISGLEMAIKVRLGKLPAMVTRIAGFEQDVAQDGFVHLPCVTAHAVMAGEMPGAHRDPFDRVIAAQAIIENLTVIGVDREIAQFGCKVLW